MKRIQSSNLSRCYEDSLNKRTEISRASSRINSKKSSLASIKENIPNLDKLIMDIKIKPQKKHQDNCFGKIYKGLQKLEKNKLVKDEVQTISLIMKGIQKKILTEQSTKKDTSLNFTKKRIHQEVNKTEASPIAKFDESSSRIVYADFSIKDLERNINTEWKQQPPQKDMVKMTVSKFEDDTNDQVIKINSEIQALEKLLQEKTRVKPTKKLFH